MNFSKKIKKKNLALGSVERLLAINILNEILNKNNSLHDLRMRNNFFPKNCPFSIKSRSITIVKNVLRNLNVIDDLISKYLKKSPNKRFKIYLRVCFSEIIIDDIPFYATVDSILKLMKNEKKLLYYVNLCNAICRNFVKDYEKGLNLTNFSFPKKFQKYLNDIYGKNVEKKISNIFQIDNPIDITFKSLVLTEKYNALFSTEINTKILTEGSLRLYNKKKISSLEGFKEGDWWVQDFSSSLPVKLLGNVNGKTALDLCAAPGGKTMQLSSLGAEVTSVDISKKRLKLVEENLIRTNLKSNLINENVLNLKINKLFDIVIVDAPCSSSGTLRKNVDLPYLDFENHIKNAVRIQKKILLKSIDWIKKGGTLVYCTCSLFPEEGEKIIENLLSKNKKIKQKKISLDIIGIEEDWIDEFGGLRLRPDFWSNEGGMDGFYISFLEKI